MIGYDLRFFIPISLILIFLGVLVFKRQKPGGWFWFTLILGLTYINCMIDKLFFPIFIDNPKDEYMLSEHINTVISFLNMGKTQIVYNIVVTIPLALALKFMYRRKFITTSIITLVCSVIIEVIQLLIIVTAKPGNIWFDLTDVILNTIGGVIGIILLFILKKICEKNKGKGVAFIKYVIDTMN